MRKIIGIDLGTTNSVVAVMEGGKPTVIFSEAGGRLLPSVVASDKGQRMVGKIAQNQAVTNPKNTIYSIKRLMGRRYIDSEVQSIIEKVPYHLSSAPNGDVRVHMGGRAYSPPEISAMILQKLKAAAEEYLNERVTDAVIAVPAYFNNAQRKATKDAGRIAGMNVLRIINEPTAASMAYGLDKQNDETIAVFDLGGGTFDISILDVGDGVFEVRSTNGDTFLGGDDFDRRIINWLLDDFSEEHGVDLRQNFQALQRIRLGAEQAKIALSTVESTDISISFIEPDKHINQTLERDKLETMVQDMIDKCLDYCQAALNDAGLRRDEIDEVILIGGMTRMPLIHRKVRQFFGKEPKRNINPDEAVALGAAIQGGVLTGDVRDLLLLDVTPLTLSIETLGGIATPLIERNTTIPAKKSQIFSTAADNQKQVEVHVLQGERPMAKDNKTLDCFILDGIPPAPRGTPQIEVTFDIDANGILNVSAQDKETGREQSITITACSGLSEEEINRLIREAEEYAQRDSILREEAEKKIQQEAEQYRKNKIHGTSPPSPNPIGAQRIYNNFGIRLDEIDTAQANLLTIFLSYSHVDGRNFAERLGADLRVQGFNTWWDNGISPDENWLEVIQSVIDQSDAMIAILTNDALQSNNAHREWQHAVERRKIPVHPVLTPGFDSGSYPFILTQIQWIDARENYNNALKKLVTALRTHKK